MEIFHKHGFKITTKIPKWYIFKSTYKYINQGLDKWSFHSHTINLLMIFVVQCEEWIFGCQVKKITTIILREFRRVLIEIAQFVNKNIESLEYLFTNIPLDKTIDIYIDNLYNSKVVRRKKLCSDVLMSFYAITYCSNLLWSRDQS